MEKEGERNVDRLPLTRPQLGTWPPNPALNPLSHTKHRLTSLVSLAKQDFNLRTIGS